MYIQHMSNHIEHTFENYYFYVSTFFYYQQLLLLYVTGTFLLSQRASLCLIRDTGTLFVTEGTSPITTFL